MREALKVYEDLYQENKGMLWAMARRFQGYCEQDRAVSVEDLFQAGFIGLVEAAQTFDKESGKPWSFHAKWYVKRAIYNTLGIRNGEFIRAEHGAVSLDRNLQGDNEESATLGDMLVDDSLPDSDEALLLDELRRSVHDALDRLIDPRQRQITEMYMIQGRSLTDVAAEIGISTTRILQLYGRALSNLSRDIRLRSLADIDERTRWYAHKGVRRFISDQSSVVEDAVLWRLEQMEKRKK